MTILVIGGASFIGGNLVLNWLPQLAKPVVNVDKLTYSGVCVGSFSCLFNNINGVDLGVF